MWLPKDERRLLQGYFLRIGEVEKTTWFKTSNWIPVMNSIRVKCDAASVKEYRAGSNGKDYTGGRSCSQYIKDERRLDVANKNLDQRGLIKIYEHQHVSEVAGITLTINGYDLGKKYNNPWLWIKLWYDEYIKNHPIWLIVSYILGIISVLLVNWLSTLFTTNTAS